MQGPSLGRGHRHSLQHQAVHLSTCPPGKEAFTDGNQVHLKSPPPPANQTAWCTRSEVSGAPASLSIRPHPQEAMCAHQAPNPQGSCRVPTGATLALLASGIPALPCADPQQVPALGRGAGSGHPALCCPPFGLPAPTPAGHAPRAWYRLESQRPHPLALQEETSYDAAAPGRPSQPWEPEPGESCPCLSLPRPASRSPEGRMRLPPSSQQSWPCGLRGAPV